MKFIFFLLIILPKIGWAIHYSDQDINKEFIQSTVSFITFKGKCTGIAIKENILITAAHCFEPEDENQKGIAVNINTYENGKNKRTSTGYYNVKIKIHPSYDLAVMTFSEKIKNIIPNQYLSTSLVGYSKNADYCVVGAGITEIDRNIFSTLNQLCSNKVYKFDEERNALYIKNTSHLLAGVDDGDSGGPVFVNIGGQFFLAGITSRGGEVDYQGEKTIVSTFIDLQYDELFLWIINNS